MGESAGLGARRQTCPAVCPGPCRCGAAVRVFSGGGVALSGLRGFAVRAPPPSSRRVDRRGAWSPTRPGRRRTLVGRAPRVVVGLLLGAVLLGAGVSARAQHRALLSAPSEATGVVAAAPLAATHETVRHRVVAVDVPTLAEAERILRSAGGVPFSRAAQTLEAPHDERSGGGKPASADAAARPTLRLNLFDDVELTAIVETTAPTLAGGFSLSGGIAGEPNSDFVLVVNGETVAGVVLTGGAEYRLFSADDGVIVVSELDPSLSPDLTDDFLELPQSVAPEEAAPLEWAPSLDPEATSGARDPDVEGIASDRATLVQFYAATGGANWRDNGTWLTDKPLSTWEGVSTDPNGRVEGLTLRNKNLVGPIPSVIGDLPKLRILDLGNSNNALRGGPFNRLHGPIPNELAALPALEQLSLRVNPGLVGPLPAQLPVLSRLELFGTDLCIPRSRSGRPASIGTYVTCQPDGVTEIDIAIFFTDFVGRALGGTAAAEAYMQASVEAGNRILAESGVKIRLVLVVAQEVDYEEVAAGGELGGRAKTALLRMHDGNDGYLDEIHGVAARAGADLVHLAFGGGGGIAFGLGPLAVWNYQSVFIFLHELGHNLGLKHQRQDCRGWRCMTRAGRVYGYGYVNERAWEEQAPSRWAWHTIMRTGWCPEEGCSHGLTRFSNPLQVFPQSGYSHWAPPHPLGNPSLELTNAVLGPADAARALNWQREEASKRRSRVQRVSVSFAESAATAAEGGAGAAVVVRLTPARAVRTEITISVSLRDGASPGDYAAPSVVVFKPGQTERSLVVNASDDAEDDDGESVVLSFANLPYDVLVGSQATFAVSLLDNDGASAFGVGVSGAVVFETRGPATFGVELTEARTTATALAYRTLDGTAVGGADYTVANGTVTIAAGATSAEIPVAVSADTVVEDDETFELEVRATLDGVMGTATAVATILDAGQLPAAPLFESVGVPTDWALIPSGESAADNEFRLLFVSSRGRDAVRPEMRYYNQFVQDRASVGHETLHPYAASFRAVGKVVGTDAAANTGLPVSVASTDPVPVYWLNGPLVVSDSALLLSGTWKNGTPNDERGTAYAGTCPLSGTGACVFTGQGANTLDHWVLGGALDQFGDPGLWVTVGRPGVAGSAIDADELASANAVLPFYGLSPVFRVVSGHVLPTVSVSGGGEVNESAGTATFTVSLDRTSTFRVAVGYATADGTAEAGSDYTTARGRLEFAAGERTKTVAVAVLADGVVEANEEFSFALGAVQNATVAPAAASARAVIVGADLPELRLIPPPRSIVEFKGAQAVFTVSLSRAASHAVSVSYETLHGTAKAGDYTYTDGTLTIASGQTLAMIAVPILDDDTEEPEETFSLGLSEIAGARLAGSSEALVALVDDDAPAGTMPVRVGVATDWGLIPAGLAALGSEFRLLFVTSGSSTGTSRDIADYNAFVQRHVAAGHAQIRSHKGSYRAIAGTAEWPFGGVSVFRNTGADPASTAGVPVYWLGGARIASDYASFFDASPAYGSERRWESRSAVDENGRTTVQNCAVGEQRHVCVFTGYNPLYPFGSSSGYVSSGTPTLAPDAGPEPALDRVGVGTFTSAGSSLPLYALSPVYRVLAADHVGPSVGIADATALESAGKIEFVVTLSAATTLDVAVGYDATNLDGEATPRHSRFYGEKDFVPTRGRLRIPAGETSATATVLLIDDVRREPDESFPITLHDAANASLDAARSSATGTIRNDDFGRLATVAPASVMEGEPAKFVLEIERDHKESIHRRSTHIFYRTRRGTAIPGEDYVGVTENAGHRYDHANVGIYPDQTSATISIKTVDDDIYEPLETFLVEIVGTTNVHFGDGATWLTVTGTIHDDDPPVDVSLTPEASAVAEGGGVRVSVALSADPQRRVVVPLTATAVGGASPADWSGVPASMTFEANGPLAQTFTLAATDDLEDDDAEGVRLGVGDLPVGMSIEAPGWVTVYIADNDGAGIALSKSALTVPEGGSGTYGVALQSRPGGSVTVTVGGMAHTDVTVSPVVLTFTTSNWAAVRTVMVHAAEDDGDALADAPVLLSHTASGPGYDGTRGVPVRVRIAENDLPAVALQDATVTESGGKAAFAATLSIPSSLAVTVDYRTADGTAHAPGDYRAERGSLKFEAGVTRLTLSVPVVDDAEDEEVETETFTVVLSEADNATLAGGGSSVAATGRIEDDDDPEVAVSFANSYFRATEGGPPAMVGVRVDRNPERTLRVPVTTKPTGGAAVGDYLLPAAVTFDAGGPLTVTFELTASDDADDDDDEAVELGFGTMPDRATAGRIDVAEVALVDNDSPGIVLPDPPAVSVREGGRASYAVRLATKPSADVVVTVGYAGSTDIEGSPPTLTFTPSDWLRSQTVTLTAAEDEDLIADDPVPISHTAAGGNYAGLTASLNANILENDVATVSVADAAASEEAGHVAFVVTLDRPSSAEVMVDYASVGLVATSPEDFRAARGVVGFPPRVTSRTLLVALVDDDADEDEEETFEIRLSSPVNATFSGDAQTVSALGTIRDDDSPRVAVSFDAATYVASEGGQPAQVGVNIDRDPERALEVELTSAGAGGASAADYALARSVTFRAGGPLTTTFAVAATDDGDDEGEETVVLGFTLPARTRAGETAEATVHLVDNDGPGLVLSGRTQEVPEGGTKSYTVALGSRPEDDVTVGVSLPAGTDLSVDPVSLTFGRDDWSAPQSVTLSAATDTDLIADEPVAISHAASGGGYDGQSAVVTATIAESDRAIVSVADASAAEGAGHVAFVVSLDRPGSAVVTVDYATADGTATAPAKYIATRGTLRFGAAETRRTIRVPVRDDDVDGELEATTFTLTFRNPSSAALAGNLAALTVTGRIEDDDFPYVRASFGADVHAAVEGEAALRLEVRIDRDPERSLVLPLTATGAGGATAADHSAVPSSLTFDAGGALTRALAFAATDDAVDDDGESVTLAFGRLPARTVPGNHPATTVHLGDNDSRGLDFSQRAVVVAENLTASYTVALQSQPTSAVSVAVSLGSEAGIGASPTLLSFRETDWAARRTITLTATAYDETFRDGVEIAHRASGGDYAGVEASVNARVEPGLPTVRTLPVTAREGDGHIDFVVTLNRAPRVAIALDYTTVDLTATAPTDYTSTSGSLRFAAPVMRQTIRVSLTDDDDDDEVERKRFQLVLRNLANGVFEGDAGALTVDGWIVDDDYPPVAVSLGASVASASEATPTVAAVVTVSLDRDPERTLSIPLEVTDQGGISGDDYRFCTKSSGNACTPDATQVRFVAGDDLTATFELYAIDDDFDDDGESVRLRIGGLPEGVTTTATDEATIHIADDDTRSLIASASALIVREAGAAQRYYVELGTKPTTDVTVTVELSPSDTDLVVSPSTLRFTPSDPAPRAVTVRAEADEDDEVDDPAIIRHVVRAGEYNGVEMSIAARIIEKDRPVLVLTDVSADEAAGHLDFVVTLDRAPRRVGTVAYETKDGSAKAGADYSAMSGTLRFAVGALSATVRVPLIDDDFDEDEQESFKLVLGNLVNVDHELGEYSRAVVGVIHDDDDPRVTVTYGTAEYSAYEGDTTRSEQLVGNLAQEHGGSNTWLAVQDGRPAAQAFTTGPHPHGYVLQSIGVYLHGQNAVPRIALLRGNGERVFEFVVPAGIGVNEASEVDVLTPPPSTVLDPGTTYSLRFLKGSGSQLSFSLETVNVPGADASAPGWSLAPLPSPRTALPGGERLRGPLRMRVSGRAAYEAIVGVSISRDPERLLPIPIAPQPQDGATAADYYGVPATVSFEAGGPLTRLFALSATDDDVDDDGETVALRFGTLPPRVSEAQDSAGRVELIDDDTRGIALTAASITVPEGKTVSYAATLTSEPVASTTVTVGVPENADVAVAPASLTFSSANWEAPQQFAVTAATDADALVPAPVHLSHTATGDGYAGVVGPELVVQVAESTLPILTFDPDALAVAEDGATVTATVRMDQPSSHDVSVSVRSEDATAYGSRPGFTGDYGSVNERLTFAAGGAQTRTVQVQINDDDRFEEAETFLLRLSAPANAAVAGSLTVTINNDDDPDIYVAFGTLTEGPLPEPELVPVADSPLLVGNAGQTASSDKRIGGSRRFTGDIARPGDFRAGRQRFTTGENFEAVYLGGIRLYMTQADVDIRAAVTVSQWAAGLETWRECTPDRRDCMRLRNPDEYPSGGGEVDFRAPPDAHLEPNTEYVALFETEDPGPDFHLRTMAEGLDPGGRVGWTLGEGNVRTGSEEGTWSNADGWFQMSVYGRDLPPSTAVLLGVSPIRAEEDGGAAAVTVTGKLNAAERNVETVVSLSVGADGDTATQGTDYASTAATLTIDAGRIFGATAITLTPVDDDEREYTETISIVGTQTDLSVVPTTFRLGDDDREETLALDVVEARYVDVAVTLSRDPERNLEVTVNASGRSGATAADYALEPASLTFEAAGALTQTVRTTMADDEIDDDGEAVELTIGGLPDKVLAVAPREVRIDIIDDDVRGVAVTPTVVEVLEGETASYGVVLLSTPTGDVAVTVDGMDPANTDLTGPTQSLTLAFTPSNWNTAQAVNLTTSADADTEADPAILLTHAVSGADYAGVPVAPVVVRILEPSAPEVTRVEVGVSFGAASYRAAEGGTVASVAVHLDRDPEREVVVPIRASPGNGATVADFSGVPTAVTFTAGGVRRRTFALTATDDSDDDDGGTVAITFGALPAAVTPSDPPSTLVALLDNDAVGVVLSAEQATVTEGASATYTVKLASKPTAAVTVAVTVPDDVELSATPAALTFTTANWSTAQTVTLAAAEDADALADAAVEVTHRAAGGDYAGLAGPTLTATIAENDLPVLAMADVRANEGAQVAFVAMLDRPSSRAITADYLTADATATAPADYARNVGLLRFAAGETRFTIMVPTVDDDADEDEAETFTLTLGKLANGAFAGGGDDADRNRNHRRQRRSGGRGGVRRPVLQRGGGRFRGRGDRARQGSGAHGRDPPHPRPGRRRGRRGLFGRPRGGHVHRWRVAAHVYGHGDGRRHRRRRRGGDACARRDVAAPGVVRRPGDDVGAHPGRRRTRRDGVADHARRRRGRQRNLHPRAGQRTDRGCDRRDRRRQRNGSERVAREADLHDRRLVDGANGAG